MRFNCLFFLSRVCHFFQILMFKNYKKVEFKQLLLFELLKIKIKKNIQNLTNF
jgi:hypothetical protein